MNDEPPQLGRGLRGELSCEEGDRVQVTVDYLSATDRDSDDFRLTYMLARSPGRGELQRAGLSVDRFSQQDLLQGFIYYVHTGEDLVLTQRVWDLHVGHQSFIWSYWIIPEHRALRNDKKPFWTRGHGQRLNLFFRRRDRSRTSV